MERRQFDPYAPRKRPWEVTLAIVLCCIQAIVDVVAGALIVLDRFPAEFASGGVSIVTLVGAATMLLGLFIFTVLSGIARGDRVARIGLTVLLLLDLASDVYLGLTDAGQTPVLIASGILSVVILLVVWTGRSRRYFAYRP